MSNILKNVAIIGATGNLGAYLTDALAKTGKHNVTALTRSASASSKLPSGVKVVEVDYNNQDSLVNALKGQDFLAIVLGGQVQDDTHSKCVQAAAKAGIKYVMPTAYGADITSEVMMKEDLYHQSLVPKIEEINSLGLKHFVLTCGFWYGYSLAHGEPGFGIDVKNKKAVFFDEGTTKISTSTFQQCARAFVALLSLPESGASPSVTDFASKPFRIASFSISQRDMLDSVQRAQGTTDKDWEITHVDSHKRVADNLAALQKGDPLGFIRSMYTRAFYSSGDADFVSKHGTHNELLGLPKEDLDEMTKLAVEEIESKA